MVRTGPSGDIRDAPDTGGGSDDEDDSGTTGGGSIPGAPDDGGGSDPPSDDPGIDPTDPSDAPSASPPDQGTDPDDPRDAPSASPPDPAPPEGGSDDATGGGQTDRDTSPAPESTPTGRGSADVDVPAGASDGGPIGERVTSNLDQLGEIYDARVADPVGDATAATNPAAQVERRVLGTNAVGEVSEGVGEGVAQIGNVPGNTAAGIDAAQALVGARARSRDQVTIGGVPTGVFVPNPEGQRENVEAAGTAAASTAAAASASPFETTGQLIGGAVGGAAVSRAARGVSGTPDVSARRPSAGPLLDDLDAPGSGTFDEFVSDTRAQRQVGGQRDRASGSGVVDADDIRERPPDPEQGPAAFPDPQGRFEGGGGFSRGSPNRGDVESPTDVGPSGGGDGFGFRSAAREAETAQIAPRAGSPTDDLRNVVDIEDTLAGPGVSGGSRFSATGAGGGVGSVSQTTDPTGIAPDPTVTGGPRVDSVNDPTSVASTTAVTGTQQVDPTSDPTAISPGVEEQLGDGRLGGGTLPGDAAGGAQTDALDGSDPTNIAPTDTGTESDTTTGVDVGPGTDTGTDTDQPPATDQPPVAGQPPITGQPPATDQPPVTDTPPTNRPPGRTPAFPPVRPPVPRRPRRPPEPDEEPDPLILGDDDDDDEPAPRPAAEAPLLPGFGAETFTAFATGAFGARELASGADEPSLVGELPTETLADPSDDEAGALAAVSEQFFGEFGGEA